MLKLVVYDIKCGIIQNWKKFLCLIIFFVLSNIFFTYQIRSFGHIYDTMIKPTWMDYMINSFHGMAKYDPLSHTPFDLPVISIGLVIIITYIIGDYIGKSMKKDGIQILIRSGSRNKWMISKMIWCFITTVMMFIIIYGIDFAFSGGGFIRTDVICNRIIGFQIPEYINNSQLLFMLIILPFFTMLAMAQIQLTLSLVFSPVIGFLITNIISFFSAYYTTPWLIGNYAMIQRNKMFIPDGISTDTALIVDVLIFLSMGIFQILYFKRKSIIS